MKNEGKDRFSFVSQDEDNLFITEDSNLKNDDQNKVVEDAKSIKKKKKKRNIITTLILIFSSGFFFGIGLLWQNSVSLMAITNAVWVAFAIMLFAAWIMFVYNLNILSPIIHGFKTFGLMIVGKKPNKSYYEYMLDVKDNQIPKFYYLSTFLVVLLLFLIGLVLIFIVEGQY